MFAKLVLRPLESVQCSTSLELDTPKEPITQYELKKIKPISMLWEVVREWEFYQVRKDSSCDF